ncbi:hypothetical protein M431DRAFT_514963 [Trichoderma harzianum CBS 226.95]|uniref:Uncharacterized protein n=1 Tax=Trichoderma harzianum CBS 226.95 TaxID=983964 RepID=A0A2T4ATY4_TRIHA|nr:hypothetical protein M431DRAFT_514963 [Trichoderma harzianum CBS 226.95]PTB60525.1 hypothetical protein M431DRAFT_514963 [Trichoderma harzianum CBS 226.95]
MTASGLFKRQHRPVSKSQGIIMLESTGMLFVGIQYASATCFLLRAKLYVAIAKLLLGCT